MTGPSRATYLSNHTLKEALMSEQRGCHRFSKIGISIFTTAVCFVALQARAENVNDRVADAGRVFQELVNASNGIPRSLLNKADCVIVLPSVKKAGLFVGGQYGKGVMSCRGGANFTGKWHTPIMMQSHGGSFGLQAGGEAVDYVVLGMNDEGARAVMNGNA